MPVPIFHGGHYKTGTTSPRHALRALGYARSMYRELMKSGRASFHYDVIRDELARLLGQAADVAGWLSDPTTTRPS